MYYIRLQRGSTRHTAGRPARVFRPGTPARPSGRQRTPRFRLKRGIQSRKTAVHVKNGGRRYRLFYSCGARCSRNSAAGIKKRGPSGFDTGGAPFFLASAFCPLRGGGARRRPTLRPDPWWGYKKGALWGFLPEELRFFADVCFLPVRREPDRVAPLCTERRHRHPQRKNARLPLAAAHLMPFEPVVYGRSFSPFSAEPAAISCCCASSSSCFCFLRARRASLRRSLAFSMSLSICSTERSTIV